MSLSRTTSQATDTANVKHRREAHPLPIRIMHWSGAILVISMMLSGWRSTRLRKPSFRGLGA